MTPTTDTNERQPAKAKRANRVVVAARILMGLIFLVMGLNGFLDFIPHPATPMPARALAFLGGIITTGYMEQLLSGVQVLVALLLLGNRFVPLALAMIAPVIVNIVAFHLFLVLSGLPIALFVAALEVYLAWAYRAAFRPMLASRTEPRAS